MHAHVFLTRQPRHALGREEGGSGVPIDRDAYEASVKYWDEHAPIRG